MKMRMLVVGGAAALLFVVVVLTIVSSTNAQIPKRAIPRTDLINDVPQQGGQAPAAPQPGMHLAGVPGRYQGTCTPNGDLWMFDTMTGEVWHAKSGGQWERSVAPLKR